MDGGPPAPRSAGTGRTERGKCLVIAPQEDCDKILRVMKKNMFGKDSRIIGEVRAENPGRVLLKTKIGERDILAH